MIEHDQTQSNDINISLPQQKLEILQKVGNLFLNDNNNNNKIYK